MKAEITLYPSDFGPDRITAEVVHGGEHYWMNLEVDGARIIVHAGNRDGALSAVRQLRAAADIGMSRAGEQGVMDALLEVRAEIARLNAAAGQTVFNPTATAMVDAILRHPDQTPEEVHALDLFVETARGVA